MTQTTKTIPAILLIAAIDRAIEAEYADENARADDGGLLNSASDKIEYLRGIRRALEASGIAGQVSFIDLDLAGVDETDTDWAWASASEVVMDAYRKACADWDALDAVLKAFPA